MSLAAPSPGCATNGSRLLCRIGVIVALLRLAREAASSVISVTQHAKYIAYSPCKCLCASAYIRPHTKVLHWAIHKFGTQK
jgi:hypothetical protein